MSEPLVVGGDVMALDDPGPELREEIWPGKAFRLAKVRPFNGAWYGKLSRRIGDDREATG